ncbi:dTDP-glucose 4,6-dehydratase [Alteromonas facilis]|uniref:dTDP-glucose 4,6-dehydratase n=1 Tax=Alteromonas facilis TaxID=2048004 RepID=UPI00196B25AD|nr:dTDP-glucose 4,6-dehydratase [Alteromonas facilis]
MSGFRKVLVTGGAGFIGSALIRHLILNTQYNVLCIDNLTYASHPNALDAVKYEPRYRFLKSDINDLVTVSEAIQSFAPDIIFHLAAESHVDNSIAAPDTFIHSNILGTYNLLKAVQAYWQGCVGQKKENFRFLYVGTDEVYGSNETNTPFSESRAFEPSSPYSASKASAALLVNSWYVTYGLPSLIAHSANNYGPYQHPEKLIAKVIKNAIEGKVIPIYGDGNQQRDWIFVDDHVNALCRLAENGVIGNTYNIASERLISNIDLVRLLLKTLSKNNRCKTNINPSSLIHHVNDRLGHDKRYFISSDKLRKLCAWAPKVPLEDGLSRTIDWYLSEFDRND